MKRLAILGLVLAGAALTATAVFAAYNSVTPAAFDPGKTYLVSAGWITGIGCPTDAFVADPSADFSDWAGTTTPYEDPACTSGDAKDKKNEGLLLAKTGPTVTNFASATAELKGVKGMEIDELGYDIRKPGPTIADDRGSHCGAGAPRFNIVADGESYFLGCSSPPPTSTLVGTGWLRLRWGEGVAPLMAFCASCPGFPLVDITGQTIESIHIVFDEGQDASGGPDNFGVAILDNVDLNGMLVGRGSTQ